MRRSTLHALVGALLLAAAMVLAPPSVATPTVSDGITYDVVPSVFAGVSPNGLGDWTVNYEKLAGGDPAVTEAVNRILDDEADGQVWLYAASASKTSPWTFRTRGRLLFRPMTISALFTGQYDAVNMPNMPIDAVATRVFDSRSGVQIVWDNLFRDRQAGLDRLSAEAKRILPQAYPTPPPGGWGEYGHLLAPVPRNFKFWIPTEDGIELHFAEGQLGREARAVTIPWPAVADLIAPEFAGITS